MTESRTWAFADRLSDKVVALVNAEIRERPDFSMADLLAGQLLALLALQRTAEGFKHPYRSLSKWFKRQGGMSEILDGDLS